MKLRNKLIPILGIAATAASVAPLASCGNIATQYTDMIDVMNGYIPTIARAGTFEGLTTTQVEDLYVEHVKKNPEILTQDIAWWEGLALNYRMNIFAGNSGSSDSSFIFDLSTYYNLIPNSAILTIPQVANFGASNIEINEVTLVNPTTNLPQKVHTISMDFNYEFDYQLAADCYNKSTGIQATANRAVKASLTSSYKNMPFEVYFDSNYGWKVRSIGWTASTRWMLAKIYDWQFTFDYKCEYTDTIEDYNHNVFTEVGDESKSDTIRTIPELLAWVYQSEDIWADKDLAEQVNNIIFNFGSYHLYDVLRTGFQYEGTTGLGYLTPYYDYDSESEDGLFSIDGLTYWWRTEDLTTGNYPIVPESEFGDSITIKEGQDIHLLVRDLGSTTPHTEADGYIALTEKAANYTCKNEQDCVGNILLFATRVKTTTETAIQWPEDIDPSDPEESGVKKFFNKYEIVIPAGLSITFTIKLASGSTIDKTLTFDKDITILTNALA